MDRTKNLDTINKNRNWNLENTYRNLPPIFYKDTMPQKVPHPQLFILNEELAEQLGLSAEYLKSQRGVDILSGNALPEGSKPIAQAYAGHQFGTFTMLGDGRAVLLGEQITSEGKRLDIQLKGSGLTAFSRGGDGKAVLGPMLREYIISEALHGLRIPTTRSLAVTTTGEKVFRYMPKPGAILTRVASSHIRAGTFQYAAAYGTKEDIKALADYAIDRDDDREDILAHENRYLRFLEIVMKRQARLVALWQMTGLVHGVMNTDNMAISGESIDFGPVAFMDSYDPSTVFSSIDTKGRYAYGNQPAMTLWNLSRLAEALLPIIAEEESEAEYAATEILNRFEKVFHKAYLAGFRKKLGLIDEEPEDGRLLSELFSLMKAYQEDFTNTFVDLTLGTTFEKPMYLSEEFLAWKTKWKSRLSRQKISAEERILIMKSVNPFVIPRNHRVEEALRSAEQGDDSRMIRLLEILKNPYAYTPKQEEYRSLPKGNPKYMTYCGT